MSATPGDYENEQTETIVEQIIRPTGLLDPEVEVRPTMGQIDDLLGEINARVEKNEITHQGDQTSSGTIIGETDVIASGVSGKDHTHTGDSGGKTGKPS